MSTAPPAPIPVQPWPGPVLAGPAGLLVLGLSLAGSDTGAARAHARLQVRAAAAQALAQLLQRPVGEIVIDNQRGQRPKIWLADPAPLPAATSAPCCAFAYSSNYALVALHLHGPVGVDLTPVLELPDWQALARDYLGPHTYARLQALAAPQRPRALAQAWCQLEAQLKCRAQGLTEWSAERDDGSLHAPLILPPSQDQVALVGHIAWQPTQAPA